jgi:hypothetical protein
VANARETTLSAIWTYAEVKDEVAAFDLNSYAVTEERHNTISWRDRGEIAVVKMLRYGLDSCHWRSLSFGWLGLVVCLLQAAGPFCI